MNATPASGGVAIQARGLSRLYGGHTALDAIDLDIAPGETFGLLGANGAGKTTFIRLATGSLLPSRGTITIDGHSPAKEPRVVQAQLGYVPETPRLYPELRVDRFLGFVAGLRGLSGAKRRDAIATTLERFELGSVARRPIANLSKGFRQRVSLAQAFLAEPPLLIVDEPTSGLDPLQRDEVRSLLGGLRGQRTIVLCTHDLREAQALTDRVAVLQQGRLMAVGATEDLLGGADPLAWFRDDEGIQPNEADASEADSSETDAGDTNAGDTDPSEVPS
jgi:ABC-2 type transport system ATP-binding protein